MNDILEKLSICVENGKIDRKTPYPPQLKDQDGADELTARALREEIPPGDILYKACIPGMNRIGERFRAKEVFVPQLLIAARAMSRVMEHLEPYFASGEIERKGTFVIGTVKGDLHDIGKNLVGMVAKGAGFKVVDIGMDAGKEKFLSAILSSRDAGERCAVGLSALLTTTMPAMSESVESIREAYADIPIFVGGAPVSKEFADEIGADCYAPDAHTTADKLCAIFE